jgi:ribosomal protein S3AE
MAKNKRASQRKSTRSRDQVKQLLREAFRKRFPNDTVDISDGYKENIHVMVVSREFDEMREDVKRELMWEIIDSTTLSEDEKTLISLVYPVSPAEIK